jgi:hypothetical protein
MLHILLLPLIISMHASRWIDAHILSPFELGTTAKSVTEDELGVFGVLSYFIFKVSDLILNAWPLFEPRWLVGRVARAVALAAALILTAWLITCFYLGLLIVILDVEVSYLSLVLAPLVGWLVLAYVQLAHHVREKRAELEAESEQED